MKKKLMESSKKSKLKVVLIVLIMLLLLILGAVAFTKIKSSNNKGLTYSSSREVVQSSSSDMEKVSENEKKFSEALATLEKSDKLSIEF